MSLKTSPSYDQFSSYIDVHMRQQDQGQIKKPRALVTISRQAGAGGTSIAMKVARFMERKMHLPEGAWSVFEKELAEKVLEHHSLPAKFAKYMPEDRVNLVKHMIEEMVGLHPSPYTLVQHTAETILYLAEIGNVILVGRGANFITHQIRHALHVRLIGSQAKRAQHLIDAHGFSGQEALKYIHDNDQARRDYVSAHFVKDIDNPEYYDLVINTDRVPFDDAARMIAEESHQRAMAPDRG
jgi:cytidylate kinase